jgi:hypothetical protein
MGKISLRDKKIAYLQKQQADLKRSLLGRTNGNEVPIKTAPLQTKQMKKMKMMQMQRMQKAQAKPTLKEEKRKSFALKQREMKMPVSKVSIKSFY